MRSYLVAGLLGSFLLACSAGAADSSDTSTGAATAGAAVKLHSGQYENLALAVNGTHVSGSYFSSVGDPAHGGATCSFTFSGTIQTVGGVEQAEVAAVDGFDSTTGMLKAITQNGTVGAEIHLNDLLNACWRSSPSLADAEGDGNLGLQPLAAGVVGFRSAAKKTFFYDRAGGNPRAAYVIQGDILSVTGPEQNGFTPVRYNTTKGFVKTADLMAENAPAKGVPAVKGSFELQNGAGISSGFEVLQVLGTDMLFNLTGVLTTGSHHVGDIEGGHATFGADGVATYDEGPDGCKIAFKFDATSSSATVTQTGACSDFGAFVDVSGTYAVK